MISVSDTKLPNPTKYNVTMSDLDSSDTTRNESGILIRNRVRQGATKIELGFMVRGSDLRTILSLIESAKVSVTYMDPRSMTTRTINAYVGDRNCSMSVYTPNMSTDEVLWDVSFNLIEY